MRYCICTAPLNPIKAQPNYKLQSGTKRQYKTRNTRHRLPVNYSAQCIMTKHCHHTRSPEYSGICIAVAVARTNVLGSHYMHVTWTDALIIFTSSFGYRLGQWDLEASCIMVMWNRFKYCRKINVAVDRVERLFRIPNCL